MNEMLMRRTLALLATLAVGASLLLAPSASADTPPAPATVEVLKNVARPTISGTLKFRKTLRASAGHWSRGSLTFRYRWLRDGKSISGATGRSYRLGPSDVGKRMGVRVYASRSGYVSATVISRATKTVKHRRSVRKTVTYRVVTRGKVTASVKEFRKLAAQTYADPRGWRSAGIAFKRVRRGGDFTLVLSQASKVPSYSSGCSSTYSCRVGRHVIINQTPWLKATKAWKAKHGSLRNYRHMVINHETGHWLGKGHAKCPGKRKVAPVMQQQSKGLGGCSINPWPKSGERHSPRFHF